MTKRQKKTFIRIILGIITFILALSISNTHETIQSVLFLLSYLIVGWDILKKAINHIGFGQIFDENLLMVLATFGAFCVKEYHEGVAVMLFYQIGELFQSIAVHRSRQSIAELMNIRPEYAYKEDSHTIIKLPPEELNIGDTILIRPGEKVPIDGIILSGSSMLDTKALTGESIARHVHEGESILSGSINLTGVLRIRVSTRYEDSTVAKILDLVENASNKKSKSEHFISKFAYYYTPSVVFAAFFLAIVPPSILSMPYGEWLHRALIFLVISCPCALVISIPLTFFGGIGGASRAGILIKGTNYLETLAKVDTIVFDKTGTLTEGNFKVVAIVPSDCSKEELLAYATYAEAFSTHPISLSLRESYGSPIDTSKITYTHEYAGKGVRATIDGHTVLVGNRSLFSYIRNFTPVKHHNGTICYVAIDNRYAGHIIIQDVLKPEVKSTLTALKELNIKKTILLTGDKSYVGDQIGQELELDEIYTELLPADKVSMVESFLEQKQTHGSLIFIGDGINDAPALSRADLGIAMGGLGSDAAIESADIVFMNDNLSLLIKAIKLAKRTVSIAYQNIIFALGVKLLVLILGAFGYATMWEAVFADVGVCIIAILNAIRTLKEVP